METKSEPKAAIYCRVSTSYQVDKDSLPVQRETLIAYAEHVLGIKDYDVFTDAGYSGKNTDRPAYQNMMQRCRQHEFTHILVYKIDRISRNLMDFAAMYDELKQLHVTFVSRGEQFDTSNAIGEAMLKIILIFAELERKMTSERVTGIMIARAKKKQWNGARVPLGYDWDEKTMFPVINSKEAEIVRFMFSSYLTKERGSSTISSYLNDHNVRTKRGGKWTATTVRHILQNPIYKGTLRYNYRSSGRGEIKPESEWIVIDDVFPAIVSNDEFEGVQKIMSQHTKAPVKTSYYYHPFRGILYCSCGSKCSVHKDKARKNGLRPSVYGCQSRMRHWGCNSDFWPGDTLLVPFVVTYIKNMLFAKSNLAKIHSASQLEKYLLQGLALEDVSHIKNIRHIWDTFKHAPKVAYKTPKAPRQTKPDFYERSKIERALTRLRKLYLYSDDEMSREEYVHEKRKLTNKLAELDNATEPVTPPPVEDSKLLEIVQQASFAKLLVSDTDLSSYDTIMLRTDEKAVSDFIHAIVSRVDLGDHNVASITFKNGVCHEFIYN